MQAASNPRREAAAARAALPRAPARPSARPSAARTVDPSPACERLAWERSRRLRQSKRNSWPDRVPSVSRIALAKRGVDEGSCRGSSTRGVVGHSARVSLIGSEAAISASTKGLLALDVAHASPGFRRRRLDSCRALPLRATCRRGPGSSRWCRGREPRHRSRGPSQGHHPRAGGGRRKDPCDFDLRRREDARVGHAPRPAPPLARHRRDDPRERGRAQRRREATTSIESAACALPDVFAVARLSTARRRQPGPPASLAPESCASTHARA